MSSARGVEGAGGVQSVGRAFEILEVIAAQGGELSLSEIAASVGLPAPSVHRLLRTLVSLGYLRQETSRRYALAPRLIRLGDAAAKQFGAWGYPVLNRLMEAIGESANMAILDGTERDLRRPGGRSALHAHVHRGRQAGAAARHRRRQGAARPAPRRRDPPDPRPRGHAEHHAAHHHRPRRPAAGAAGQPDPRLPHRRRRAGGRRVLRRRCPCRARRRPPPSRSPRPRRA